MSPHGLSPLLGVIPEDGYPVLVLLQEVIHQGQQILDGLIFGDVTQQIIKSPGALHRVLLDHPVPLLGVTSVESGDECEVILGHHLGSKHRQRISHQMHQTSGLLTGGMFAS